jgi:hypothetical protein
MIQEKMPLSCHSTGDNGRKSKSDTAMYSFFICDFPSGLRKIDMQFLRPLIKRCHCLPIRGQVADGRIFTGSHQTAEILDILADDCGELAFKIVLCHELIDFLPEYFTSPLFLIVQVA